MMISIFAYKLIVNGSCLFDQWCLKGVALINCSNDATTPIVTNPQYSPREPSVLDEKWHSNLTDICPYIDPKSPVCCSTNQVTIMNFNFK